MANNDGLIAGAYLMEKEMAGELCGIRFRNGRQQRDQMV